MTLHSHLKLYHLNHSGMLNFDSSMSSATFCANPFADISSISISPSFVCSAFHSLQRKTCHNVISAGSFSAEGAITTSCFSIDAPWSHTVN